MFGEESKVDFSVHWTVFGEESSAALYSTQYKLALDSEKRLVFRVQWVFTRLLWCSQPGHFYVPWRDGSISK